MTAAICGLLLLAIWLCFCFHMIFVGFSERDWFSLGLGCFSLLATIGFVCVVRSDTQREKENPCVAWGPPIKSFMLVGKVVMPVTRTPCIQRQFEVEK